MKNTEITKLRDKSADELKAMAQELRDGMLKTRIARSLEGKQAGMSYRVSRRQIARIETLLTQKASGAAPVAKAAAPTATADKKPAAAKKPRAAKTEKKA